MALTVLSAIRIIVGEILQYIITLWPFWLISKRFRVKGKRTVFVTGCDTGFGNLVAKDLDRLGVRVFAGVYTPEGGNQLKAETSNQLTIVPLDVTKSDSILAAYETVRAACPEGIWALINNAGIADFSPSDCALMPTFRRISDVNLFGLVDMTSRFMPLIKQQQGRVINVASVAGLISAPGMGAYSISKFGVEAYSDALRREVHLFGVKVVLIEPAFMATPLIEASKLVAMQQKGWDALPLAYRNDFGEEWIAKQMANMKPVLETADNPMKVVHVLVDSVFSRYVPHRFLVGRGAIIAKILSMIPSQICDILFVLMHENNLPKCIHELRARGSSKSPPAAAPASPLAVASPVNQSSASKKASKKKNK